MVWLSMKATFANGHSFMLVCFRVCASMVLSIRGSVSASGYLIRLEFRVRVLWGPAHFGQVGPTLACSQNLVSAACCLAAGLCSCALLRLMTSSSGVFSRNGISRRSGMATAFGCGSARFPNW